MNSQLNWYELAGRRAHSSTQKTWNYMEKYELRVKEIVKWRKYYWMKSTIPFFWLDSSSCGARRSEQRKKRDKRDSRRSRVAAVGVGINHCGFELRNIFSDAKTMPSIRLGNLNRDLICALAICALRYYKSNCTTHNEHKKGLDCNYAAHTQALWRLALSLPHKNDLNGNGVQPKLVWQIGSMFNCVPFVCISRFFCLIRVNYLCSIR